MAGSDTLSMIRNTGHAGFLQGVRHVFCIAAKKRTRFHKIRLTFFKTLIII